MTDPLALLADLEKNPGARKYTDAGYDLEGYRAWLRKANVSADGARWIHVAGTKGKGSTAAMTEALLRSFGLRTGLYTSPHIDQYGERYRIDGTAWTRERFREAVQRIEPHIDSGRTVFEVLTAIAFREFAAANVDAGILETGLGGRLDCTNAIAEPAVCAITSIGMDHTAILGDTIERIASEKAGIAKPGSPLVVFDATDADSERARAVIVEHAARTGAPVCEPCGVKVAGHDGRAQILDIEWMGERHTVRLPLAGEFQARNFGIALRVAEIFLADRAGSTKSADALQEAMALVHWPGRLEVVDSDPPLLIDAAHCPLSAKALGGSLHEFGGMLPATLLWGMQRDKDHRAFLASLTESAPKNAFHRVVCYTVPGSRGTPGEELAAVARGTGLPVAVADGPAAAWRLAREDSPRPAIACGTVYTIGEFRKLARGAG